MYEVANLGLSFGTALTRSGILRVTESCVMEALRLGTHFPREPGRNVAGIGCPGRSPSSVHPVIHHREPSK